MLPSNFGFHVRSRHPFSFLRKGGGSGSLEIGAETTSPALRENTPLLEWKLQGTSRDVVAKLYGIDHMYRFWMSDTGWYHIDPTEGTIFIPECDDEIVREHRLWGIQIGRAHV